MEMEIAAEQQWQQAEEEEADVAADAVALQGRRPRLPNTTAAAASIGESSNGDVMVTSPEPSNGFGDGEYRQQELPNGNGDGNGGGASKWNVYFDNDQGIWKCRNCFWTYQSGSPWIDHTQHPKCKWQLHMPMHVETVDQQGQCFYCEIKDTKSINGLSMTENSSVQVFSSEKNPGDDGLVITENNFVSQSTVINHQHKQILKDGSFSGKSFEEHNTNKSISDITVACDDTELIKESDQELAELDVEGVLEKQDTHDLYCPNCNSCITRRVILRKRKRKIRIPGEDAKRNKLETVVASELDAISGHATNDQGHNAVDFSLDGSPTPAANDNNRDREPEIFRCLSCFSFFIPTGNGFKMFNIFGDKRDKETMQNPQQISAKKKNWLSSIFASRNDELLIVPASNQEVTSPPQLFGAHGLVITGSAEPPEGGDDIVPSSTQGSELLEKVLADRGEKLVDVMKKQTERAAPYHPELDTVNQLNLSRFSDEMLLNHESDHPATQITGKRSVHTEEPAETAVFKPQQDGLKILVHSSAEYITLEKSQTDQKLNVAIERKSADDKGSSILLLSKPVSVLGELDINEKVNIVVDLPSENGQVKLPTKSIVEDKNEQLKLNGNAYPSGVSSHAIIGTKVDIHVEEPLKADTDALTLSVQDVLLRPERLINTTKDLKDMPAKTSAGSDTIIIIKEGPVEPAEPHEARDIVASAAIGPSPHTEITEARGFQGLDVIKSIVYGGLIESITSLGIVSSAAGADAATSNILALGLANLIGGLFIIGHNLWELKNDRYEGVSSHQVTERLDKYQELLGRRENFLLHATVVILSFLIFGLLPPVIYGFSFRESNNRDFKLIAVAVASLLCVTILATGKAYVQRPLKAYIKTVMYYVIVGFMASCVSYTVGDLIKELLEKHGFNSGDLALTLPILEATSTQSAWESY
ncbi:membrane protein of ER body-like protein isoform X3 [Camellia sinensis]|uniref:membrane protein of ER body-like protein isoform X3 n=1 Tax=Camellia sinensis TaxID=4442 RepID=UPI00103561E9|nr:membrane protein of ER body-like protein isoform X3 [Camellia sinensis]